MAPHKLKVFRTSAGFHDVYVAVTSKKAALQAWGSDKDLFSMNAAELVTDPKLIKVSLEHLGEVIRVAKGSTAEHVKAAGRNLSKRNAGAQVTAAAPSSTVRPRPSRRALDNAEAALTKFEEATERELGDLRARENESELLKFDRGKGTAFRVDYRTLFRTCGTERGTAGTQFIFPL